MTVVHKNKMYVIGGYDNFSIISCKNILCLDLDLMIWKNILTDGNAPAKLAYHTGDIIDNSIYIFGGNIKSLTGNIPIKVKGKASALTRAPNRPWWIGLGGAILGNTPVEGQASLVTKPNENNGEIDYSTGGQPDLIRATHIGLPDNSNFSIGPIPFIGNINFKTTDCNLFGIPTCFPLSQFKSLNVGEKQPDGTFDPTGG